MLDAGRFKLVLTDSDIISKLSHWRLLHHLPDLCGCDLNEITTLPTVVIRAFKAMAKPDRIFRDTETARYANAFLSQLSTDHPVDGECLSVLQRNQNIDGGEAILIAIALAHDNALLVSGDKRALRSIAELQGKGELVSIRGHVMCLEQILTCLIRKIGFTEVQAAIRMEPKIDTSINMVCGSQIDAPYEQVMDGLGSYIRHLAGECPALLVEHG